MNLLTKEKILSLVEEYFVEEWCEEDGDGWVEFAGKPDAFLKFAEKMYSQGKQDGYDEAVYNNGGY